MRWSGLIAATLALAFTGVATAKQPNGYSLVENATLVQPGNASATAAEATSTGDPFTWGAVNLRIPAKLTLRQLNSLASDYKFVVGSCWGGSPRFEAWVNDGAATHKIFFYLGPAPSYTGCPAGVYANTGNLASPSSPVDADQIGGGYADPYSTVQSRYGRYAVTAVYLDLDGGWAGTQTVDFDNSQVNGKLVTYDR
jgi:hypothetical protein